MTKDDVRRLAREAGAAVGKVMPDGPEIIFPNPMDVYLFASLVAELEREKCARVCDELETCSDAEFYGHEFSAAIRARKNP